MSQYNPKNSSYGTPPEHGWSINPKLIYSGSIDDVWNLIQEGVNVNRPNPNSLNKTPLLAHVSELGYEDENRYEIINLLIDYGANLLSQDDNGNTVIHYTVRNPWMDTIHWKIIESILEKNPEILFIENNAGITPFQMLEDNISKLKNMKPSLFASKQQIEETKNAIEEFIEHVYSPNSVFLI